MTTDTCRPAGSPAARAMGEDAAGSVALALKALAEPLRLRALSLLATSPQGEACVCDIAELADVSLPTVSHHLKVLKDAGIVTSQRRGTWVYYSITATYTPAVRSLLEAFAPAVVDHDLARLTGPAVPPGEPMGGLDALDEVLDRVSATLAGQFPTLEHARVEDVVRESATALARTAGVRAHLVVLTERFARQRLEDLAKTAGAGAEAADARPQVLFVCVANAGRSQLAAGLLHRYAGDRVVVRSAGSVPAADVHPHVRPLLDAIDPGTTAFPKPLTDDAVRAADVVITMGCGDVCPVYPGIRYEDWQVGDPSLASAEGAALIRDDIDARVRGLLADLVPDLTLPA
ncbi:metalloregulator ArsR/SmtB family transcription factor [Cellulomonas soli]|uniref:metalloregulator ArsR/SmtB family transcription factor n=1 Tax=Cellulomonas soli TaxID=931535 RepID=UPI003F827E57